MSYAMQPVVTMQMVPTMSYGVVTGPVQPAAAVPFAPMMSPSAAVNPCPPCPPCPSGDLQAQLQDALKTLRALQATMAPAAAAPPAGDPCRELNAEIARLKEEIASNILRLGNAGIKNKKDIEAILNALTTSDDLKEVREKLKNLPK